MPNYITDDTPLPATKVDRRPLPPGASATQFEQASDWNAVFQFLEDARDAIQAMQAELAGAMSAVSLALSSSSSAALSIPDGGINVAAGTIYGKRGLFGDGGDTSLGVVGTTNLEVLRFNAYNFTFGSDIHDTSPMSGADRTSNIRINPTADIDFTGMTDAGDNGRLMMIHNISDTYNLTLRNNDSRSSLGNRFRLPGGVDSWVLPPYGKAFIIHENITGTATAGDAWVVAGWGSSCFPQIKIGGATGPTWTSGSGSPEGAVTAPIGSLYSNTDGGANTTLYVKTSGSGNTGWTAK